MTLKYSHVVTLEWENNKAVFYAAGTGKSFDVHLIKTLPNGIARHKITSTTLKPSLEVAQNLIKKLFKD